jgi:transposase
MARTRAIITETERKYISREVRVSENRRYQAISRVRDRLEELRQDVSLLEKHHPQLLSELREIVYREGFEEDTRL